MDKEQLKARAAEIDAMNPGEKYKYQAERDEIAKKLAEIDASERTSKPNILKETFDAITRNQAGMGGSAMSGMSPTIQQKQEDQRVIDETAEATGLSRDKGLLKDNAVYKEDVAQNLADRGVAVKDEYKEKHPEVYQEGFQLGEQADAVSAVTQPSKNDTPKEATAKKKYNKSMMSIWDAYHNGDIDPETAGYFTIDAIATLAKNLGRSMGNVAAQFSGGTIDNGHDESRWEQRQDKMFNTELQAESEGVDTFQNKFNKLALNKASTVNDLLNAVKEDAYKLSDDNPLKIAYLSLAASIANGQVDGNTTLAATGAKGISELFDFLNGEKKQ